MGSCIMHIMLQMSARHLHGKHACQRHMHFCLAYCSQHHSCSSHTYSLCFCWSYIWWCRSILQVYIGNLVGGLVTEEALRQLFNNTMAAAFPDQVC